MTRIEAARTIDAPAAHVFDTVAHIENFRKAVPHITNVEILSGTTRGVGTRFRETRVMKGREASTELEVTEYVPNERVRLVSRAGGTLWDSVFTVTPRDDGTQLRLIMDANAERLLARLFNPLIKGMIAKALENDMDAVKRYCETHDTAPATD